MSRMDQLIKSMETKETRFQTQYAGTHKNDFLLRLKLSGADHLVFFASIFATGESIYMRKIFEWGV